MRRLKMLLLCMTALLWTVAVHGESLKYDINAATTKSISPRPGSSIWMYRGDPIEPSPYVKYTFPGESSERVLEKDRDYTVE